jgi:hypothetical protein
LVGLWTSLKRATNMATNMTRMRTFHNFFSVIHKVAKEHEGQWLAAITPEAYQLLIGFRKAVTNLLKTEGKQLDTCLCHEFLSHFWNQWQDSVMMLASIQEVWLTKISIDQAATSMWGEGLFQD